MRSNKLLTISSLLTGLVSIATALAQLSAPPPLPYLSSEPSAVSNGHPARTIANEFFRAVFVTGDVGKLNTYVAATMLDHGAMAGEQESGRESLRRRLAEFRFASPDAVFTLVQVVSEGEMAVIYYTVSGRHEGLLAGHTGNGSSFQFSHFDMMRVKEGLIVEYWGGNLAEGALFQLGLAPLAPPLPPLPMNTMAPASPVTPPAMPSAPTPPPGTGTKKSAPRKKPSGH
ncbi:MAG: ester cyclase [Calditrichaeota bacterium]|nr:ester cyclase [Calditrichota bacterium]